MRCGPRLSTCLLMDSGGRRLCWCRPMDSRGPAALYWCLLVATRGPWARARARARRRPRRASLRRRLSVGRARRRLLVASFLSARTFLCAATAATARVSRRSVCVRSAAPQRLNAYGTAGAARRVVFRLYRKSAGAGTVQTQLARSVWHVFAPNCGAFAPVTALKLVSYRPLARKYPQRSS